jgi:hypothetical protein
MLAKHLCGEAATPPANDLPASALALPLLRMLNSSCGFGGAVSYSPRVALLKTHKTGGTSVALVLRQLAHRHNLTVLEPGKNAIPRLGCPWALQRQAGAAAPGRLWLGSEGRPPQWALPRGVGASSSANVPGGTPLDARAPEAAPTSRHGGGKTGSGGRPQADRRLGEEPVPAPRGSLKERPADRQRNAPGGLGGERDLVDVAADRQINQLKNQQQQTHRLQNHQVQNHQVLNSAERDSVDVVASHVLPVTLWYSHRQADSNKTCDRQDGRWVEQVHPSTHPKIKLVSVLYK